MLEKDKSAMVDENTAQAGMVFTIDTQVDNYYYEALKILSEHLASHPEDIFLGLNLVTVLRKVERIGDHCNNIMEELVFYIDAKVLKHQKLKDNKEG